MSSPLARGLVLLLVLVGSPLGLIAQPTAVNGASTSIVISQIYGDGGSSGAPWTNDFVELFNRGSESVSLAGWSVQYKHDNNLSWFEQDKTDLPPANLAPGQYLLLQEGGGLGGTSPLPAPDVVGSVDLFVAQGEVALVTTTALLSCGNQCAGSVGIVDFVGYGNVADYEGQPAAIPTDNTSSLLRASAGCADTVNNAADFASAPAVPRNSASPLFPCSPSTPTATNSPTSTDTPASLTPTPTNSPTASATARATTAAPTPSSTLPLSVTLNELLLLPDPSFPIPYVELYNAAPLPAVLQGWQLATGGQTYSLTLTLAAGEYHVIDLDGGPTLPATIQLLRPDGTSADSVQLAAAQPGVALGRLPDGRGPWVDTAPSPGQPNSPVPTPTPSTSPTDLPTAVLASPTQIQTPPSPSRTPTTVRSATPTRTATETQTPTATRTPTLTATPIPSRTNTPTAEPTRTVSPSRTVEPTAFPSVTTPASAPRTPSPTRIPSPTGPARPAPLDPAGTALTAPPVRHTLVPRTPTHTARAQPHAATTHPPIKGISSPGGPAPTTNSPSRPAPALPGASSPPTAALPHQILIQQLLYNAPTAHPNDEWVVLHNTGPTMIVLRGWSLADAKLATKLPAITLPQQAFVVLAATPSAALTGPAGVPVVLLNHRIGNGLSDAGDRLILRDGTGRIIDALSWGTDRSVFDPPAPAVARGHWLIRRDDHDTDTAADWLEGGPSSDQPVSSDTTQSPATTSSGQTGPVTSDGPTTTTGGAQQPGHMRVLLSEIAPGHSFVELYNMEAIAVALSGWELRINGADSFPLSDDTTIPGHGFVLVNDPDLHLSAQNGSVQLIDADGTLADSFQYARIPANLSASRYPVHGGGWQIGTPLTPGTWNLPASTITPTAGPEASAEALHNPTASATTQSMGQNWTLYNTGLPLTIVLAAAAMIGFRLRRDL